VPSHRLTRRWEYDGWVSWCRGWHGGVGGANFEASAMLVQWLAMGVLWVMSAQTVHGESASDSDDATTSTSCFAEYVDGTSNTALPVQLVYCTVIWDTSGAAELLEVPHAVRTGEHTHRLPSLPRTRLLTSHGRWSLHHSVLHGAAHAGPQRVHLQAPRTGAFRIAISQTTPAHRRVARGRGA
jgi:hypothetical protein